MQKVRIIEKQADIIKPHGLMGLFMALFLATQILYSFHTHNPFHDTDPKPKQQTECGVCLLAGTPIDSNNSASISPATPQDETDIILPVDLLMRTYRVSPDRARAPPQT